MAGTFVLLLCTNGTMWGDMLKFSGLLSMSSHDLTWDELFSFLRLFIAELVLAVAVVAGCEYSIYHAFKHGRKTRFEKRLMLIFATYVNALAGIAGGVHVFKESHGFLMIFPVWNIICGAWLLFLFRTKAIDESNVSDRDVELPHVLVGLAVLGIVFALCQYVCAYYWAITFSICVGYATSFSKLIWRLPTRLPIMRTRSR